MTETTPAPAPGPTSSPVDANPGAGGSYIRNADTGALELIQRTGSAHSTLRRDADAADAADGADGADGDHTHAQPASHQPEA